MNRYLVMALGATAGATAGVLAALLLAPAAGKELRRDLRASARTLGSAAQAGCRHGQLRVTELMGSGSDLARQVRGRISDLGVALSDQADRLRRANPQLSAVEPGEEAIPVPLDVIGQAAAALEKVQATLEALRSEAQS